MPVYTAVPTKQQWKNDLGLSTVFGNYKSPFPAMERLGKLIAEYHEVPGRGNAKKVVQVHLVYLMYRACQFIEKNDSKGADYAKEKMGGHLKASQFGAVVALKVFLKSDLQDFLGCDPAAFDAELMATFGRDVTDHGKDEDRRFVAQGAMDWYQSDAARQVYKLAFRSGLAYSYDYDATVGGKGNLNVYDTAGFGDAIEYGGSLFVMDARGRIYVNGQPQNMNLKHSSFMAGQAVQCAGGIRFDRGKLVWVSGKSGHYQPTVSNMVIMLERLRNYQIDLSRVIVYRENLRQNFPNSPCRDFEPCPALTLMTQRAWPTGVLPESMRVAR